ncbi:cyclin-A2 [Leptopilina boulardi]|uniref:cyclin-A2 n=1 Tax=Leptopilina boulardi TaxID=63433 RepID=UPI0021F5FE61|nr:cyclin-A2 [Leptopilina boulardi]
MASIRVHEDQENRVIAEIRRQGKENASVQHQNQTQQQKRAVLGVLQNNCPRAVKPENCKDEKSKAKTYIPINYEQQFNICDERKEDTMFQIYEDKLQEETSVALRETNDGNKELLKIKHVSEQVTTIKIEKEKPTLQVNPIPIINNNIVTNTIRIHQDDNNDDDNNDEIANEKKENVECPMSLEKSISSFSDSSSLTKKDNRTKAEIYKAIRTNFFEVNEYRADIYNYLRSAETVHRPKAGYMKKQPDITHLMRSILVDWLVEVAEEYRLQSETLYLAVSYIDRFLSYMSVVRAKLQLVGTAAMFIAAKYEEIYPPDVGEFVFITDDTYSKKQVLRMEHLILRVLSFDLTVPTPLSFLMEYCTSNNLSEKSQFLAMYLCELSMLEADPFLHFLPSILAASSVALARHTLNEEVWPHELELSSGYNLQDLKTCIICLQRTFNNANNIQQQAIQEKYKSNKFGHVSLLLPRNSSVFDCEEDLENV